MILSSIKHEQTNTKHMLNFGVAELAVIAFLALLFFGASRLPSLAKSMGESIKEVRKAVKDEEPKVLAKAKK
jgi:sec-independent protein translocase protein TatA